MLACLLWLMLVSQQRVVMRIEVTVPVDPPEALTAFLVQGGSSGARGEVRLRWKASPDSGCKGWTGTIVYRAQSGGVFKALSAALPAQTSYVDNSIASGREYQYEVLAWANGTASKPSNVVTVK